MLTINDSFDMSLNRKKEVKWSQKCLNIENKIPDFNIFADNKTMAVFEV